MVAANRHREIANFYADQAHDLRHVVASRARNAPAATIEDACHFAWTRLLVRPDVALDHRGFWWLATVAIHEAWRLASTIRESPVGAYLPDDDPAVTMPERPADLPDTLERVIAREQHARRVGDLRLVKPRERRDLYLKALGYSYNEIAERTGSTYTAVDRHIKEGRARLRKLARERERLAASLEARRRHAAESRATSPQEQQRSATAISISSTGTPSAAAARSTSSAGRSSNSPGIKAARA
jgi:DNA-directed RNA polymerase specialized sigma24 family protein